MEDKIKEAVKVYDKIAGIYSKYNYEKLLQFQLTKFEGMLKGKRILDAGCGIGRDVEYLMGDGFDVIGVDLSKNMIEEAKKLVPKGNFKVMDFRKMSFKDKSFDGIWCMSGLIHTDRKEMVKTLKEFNRVLDEHGALYISVHEGEGEKEVVNPRYEEPRFFYYFKLEEMETYLIDAGFSIYSSEITFGNNKKWVEIFARKES